MPSIEVRTLTLLATGLLFAACGPATSSTATVTYSGQTYTCTGEAGCCCNAPVQHNDPSAGTWPDCATGYECVALQPGGVTLPAPLTGRIDVNVCRDRNASPAAVPQIANTQPSYCRVDIP